MLCNALHMIKLELDEFGFEMWNEWGPQVTTAGFTEVKGKTPAGNKRLPTTHSLVF